MRCIIPEKFNELNDYCKLFEDFIIREEPKKRILDFSYSLDISSTSVWGILMTVFAIYKLNIKFAFIFNGSQKNSLLLHMVILMDF